MEAVKRLVQISDDLQSKTSNQQAVPMTSNDVSHYGEKTHEVNNMKDKFVVAVSSPVFSIKQQPAILNLEDRPRIPSTIMFNREMRKKIDQHAKD